MLIRILSVSFFLVLSMVLLNMVVPNTDALAADSELSMQGFTEGLHKTCIECHQSDPVKQIFLTKHADANNSNTPAAKDQCESCHGPSAAHANFPLQVKNIQFGDNSANSKQEQNKVCLECHQDEARKDWTGGVHDQGELSCANCHTLHKEKDPLLDDTRAGFACIGCHKDKRAQQHIKGLHLIENGKVGCSDCHNPHAKLDTQLCVNCHEQDKQTLASQSQKAQSFHATMIEKKLPCLECHRGVAHGVPSWVEDIKKQQDANR